MTNTKYEMSIDLRISSMRRVRERLADRKLAKTFERDVLLADRDYASARATEECIRRAFGA